VGVVYFALYYGLFRLFIRRFNLKTPGREDAAATPAAQVSSGPMDRASAFIEALGGAANLITIGACTTRLRLVVGEQNAIDEVRLKALGARGLVRPSARDLQVVVGTTADQLAREIGEVLERFPADQNRSALSQTAQTQTPGASSDAKAVPTFAERAHASGPAPVFAAQALAAALGGRENLTNVEVRSTRLIVGLAKAELVDEAAVLTAGARALAVVKPDRVHVVIGPEAGRAGAALKALAPV
jgi:PTS system N-acetylglucosamine-specific IIC component